MAVFNVRRCESFLVVTVCIKYGDLHNVSFVELGCNGHNAASIGHESIEYHGHNTAVTRAEHVLRNVAEQQAFDAIAFNQLLHVRLL